MTDLIIITGYSCTRPLVPLVGLVRLHHRLSPVPPPLVPRPQPRPLLRPGRGQPDLRRRPLQGCCRDRGPRPRHLLRGRGSVLQRGGALRGAQPRRGRVPCGAAGGAQPPQAQEAARRLPAHTVRSVIQPYSSSVSTFVLQFRVWIWSHSRILSLFFPAESCKLSWKMFPNFLIC